MSGSVLTGPALPAPSVHSLPEMLARASAHDGGLIFVRADEGERRVSWRELSERTVAIALSLRTLGIAAGDRVALLFPTSVEFVEAFFAIARLGAVPVPLYPPVRLGRLDEYHRSTARMLRISGARLVLADAQVRLLLGAAIEDARPPLGCLTLAQLSRASGTLIDHAPRPDELALVQFSSGSTVDPKPVALTHRALTAQCAALEVRAPVPEGAARMGASWLPLYHDMGLIGCLLSAAYYPGWLALLPPEAFLTRPAIWLRAISRHRAFISPAPNFAYGLCVKRIKDEELEGVDLSCWRYALNGAEAISADTLSVFTRRFARWGFRAEAMLPVYGLSEASLAVTFSSPRAEPRVLQVDAHALASEGAVRPGARKLVSVGAPIAGTELRIEDALGAVLPEDRVGRVLVKSPSVMHGYHGNEVATSATLTDGWLDTGDLGFVRDGELYLSGRAKDVVIVRGANHSPQTFEEALLDVEGVRIGCCAALGFQSPVTGEDALLILCERALPASEDATVEQRIRTAVLAATGIAPHTVSLLPAGTLPRTSSGKLRRREALQRFLSQTLTPPKKLSPFSVAIELARSALAHRRARRDEA